MDSPTPLVSIIVITYNSSEFVLETLESAKAQTYQNIELIISDDCSKDNTVEICKEWLQQNKDRFVRTELLTVEQNTGIPANCNRGVKESKGEWVKLIAGDDVLSANCIEQNINYIEENSEINVLFSVVQKFTINSNTTILGDKSPSKDLKYFFDIKLSANEQHRMLLIRDYISNTPSSFIKKEVFSRIGYFDERFPLIEDYPYWLKLTKNNVKLFLMDKCTILYRIHKNSVYNGSIDTKKIVSKELLRNELWKKEYILTHYNNFGKLHTKSIYFTYNLCRNMKDTRLNRIFFKFITIYLNPFSYLYSFLLIFIKKEDILLKKQYKKKS